MASFLKYGHKWSQLFGLGPILFGIYINDFPDSR